MVGTANVCLDTLVMTVHCLIVISNVAGVLVTMALADVNPGGMVLAVTLHIASMTAMAMGHVWALTASVMRDGLRWTAPTVPAEEDAQNSTIATMVLVHAYQVTLDWDQHTCAQ